MCGTVVFFCVVYVWTGRILGGVWVYMMGGWRGGGGVAGGRHALQTATYFCEGIITGVGTC